MESKMKRLHSIFLTTILIAVTMCVFGITAHAETEEIISDAFKNMWKTDWSPDGKHIAFSAQSELYMVVIETGEIIHLTEKIEDSCSFPVFSPDSSELYFTMRVMIDGVKPSDLSTYVMDLATGETRLVFDNVRVTTLSRDGRYAVYVKEMRTHAVYEFQTGEEKIYDFANSGSVPKFEHGHSEISPDNTYFFTTAGALENKPAWNELNDYWKLYKVDMETGDAEKMEIGDLCYWYPRISPDGTKLLLSQIDNYTKEVPRYPRYTRDDETGELIVDTGEDLYMPYVYVKDPETGEFVNLSYESWYLVEGHQDIYGKKNGEYFLVENSGWYKTKIVDERRYEVVIYDLNTGELTKVVDAGYFETKFGSWSPDGSQICYVLLTEDKIGSLYIYDIEQGVHKIVVNGETAEIGPTTVEKAEPTSFVLTGNYPNPFNPTTTIEFTLQKAGDIRLDIYNVMGQKVRELVSETLTAGSHSVVWDGRDSNGVAVSSGVYISRLKMGEQVQTKQMMLVK